MQRDLPQPACDREREEQQDERADAVMPVVVELVVLREVEHRVLRQMDVRIRQARLCAGGCGFPEGRNREPVGQRRSRIDLCLTQGDVQFRIDRGFIAIDKQQAEQAGQHGCNRLAQHDFAREQAGARAEHGGEHGRDERPVQIERQVEHKAAPLVPVHHAAGQQDRFRGLQVRVFREKVRHHAIGVILDRKADDGAGP